MKTIRNISLFICSILLLAACNKVSYKKSPGGMPYKLYRGEGKDTIKVGEVIKVHFKQQIKDSVYYDTHDKFPLYIPVTGMVAPYDISELWTKLHKGDSIIATQVLDTFIKRNRDQVPPEFKNGDQITTWLKIVDVFPNDSAAREDEKKLRDARLANEIKEIEKYLQDKNIRAQKTKSGSFVEVKNPGTGASIDSGSVVHVMYKGTSFSGTVFDTNMDSSFNHTDPLIFPVSQGRMIKGFDEAMPMLKSGGEATIYIPSMLGYGAQPGSPLIKPFEHLIFNVKVVDVKPAGTALPQQF